MLAWRRFLRAHALVTRRLEGDLLAEQRLPLRVVRRARPARRGARAPAADAELADAVLLSRSGLTRLVDRFEREGLVRREACDEDAAGCSPC